MLGCYFIEVIDGQLTAQGRVVSDLGRGNFALQFFGPEGKPSVSIPVKVVTSDQMVNSFHLFPTIEGAQEWLSQVTQQAEQEPAQKKPARRKRGSTKAPTPPAEG